MGENVSDYAWICAGSLNSEHTQIAFPGIALVDGYGINNNKTGIHRTTCIKAPILLFWEI
jgi:hypothetical protein